MLIRNCLLRQGSKPGLAADHPEHPGREPGRLPHPGPRTRPGLPDSGRPGKALHRWSWETPRAPPEPLTFACSRPWRIRGAWEFSRFPPSASDVPADPAPPPSSSWRRWMRPRPTPPRTTCVRSICRRTMRSPSPCAARRCRLRLLRARSSTTPWRGSHGHTRTTRTDRGAHAQQPVPPYLLPPPQGRTPPYEGRVMLGCPTSHP